jgi:hypothetical protein
MSVRSFLLMCAVGCGGGESAGPDDAAVSNGSDDAAGGSVTETRVSGNLSNSGFVLQYASAQRGTTSDPRIWLCVADVDLPYDQCQATGGPARIMFLGPFYYDTDGTPKWAFPQVWLYRVGTAPVSKYATSGTLTVVRDDAAANRLELTLNVDFGETPVTSGSVAIGP